MFVKKIKVMGTFDSLKNFFLMQKEKMKARKLRRLTMREARRNSRYLKPIVRNMQLLASQKEAEYKYTAAMISLTNFKSQQENAKRAAEDYQDNKKIKTPWFTQKGAQKKK